MLYDAIYRRCDTWFTTAMPRDLAFEQFRDLFFTDPEWMLHYDTVAARLDVEPNVVIWIAPPRHR